MTTARCLAIGALSVTLAASVGCCQTATAVPPEVVELARQYLNAAEGPAREELGRRLDASGCDPERVVQALKPVPPAEARRGYLPNQPFATPELRERYPTSRLYLRVPQSYRPEQPSALIIFMHGGGKGTDPYSPASYFDPPREEGKESLGAVLDATGAIAVAPSALPDKEISERWCLPAATDYLRDVVLEMSNRYAIDPDRVFLTGQSMGGWGGYHQVQVQPDRFAAVLTSAGAWRSAWWPVIRGTPLWMVQGVHDADWRDNPGTHVDYARIADRNLTEQGLEHEYFEHPGGHSLGQGGLKGYVHFFTQRLPQARRDAYYPHIAAITPSGFRTDWRWPTPHNRWVSIVETREGTLPHDTIGFRGPWRNNQANWRMFHQREELPGASLEAINRGGNLFEVTATHVSRFSLWLHPKMADLSQPVRVVVNGQTAFEGRVTPSVSTALRSWERRRDWGLIYPAELTVDVP